MKAPTLETLRSLDPARFEQLIAELMELSGFQNVVVLGGSGDEGIDIRAEWPQHLPTGDTLTTSWVVQCKRYTRSIGRKDMLEILNDTLALPADLVPSPPDFFLVATSSRLAPTARRIVERANSDKSKYSCRFMVWDGEAIIKRVANQTLALDRFFQPVQRVTSKPAVPEPDPVIRLSILLDPAGDDVLITFMAEFDGAGPTMQRHRTTLSRDEFDQLVEGCQQLASTALFSTYPEESERLLKAIGRRLYRLIPEPIARTLRDHRDSYIRIASNIHVLPFELAFDDVSNDFLGDTCFVGRIQVSETGLVHPLTPEPSILLIGSVDNADIPPLPEASRELDTLAAVLSKWGLRVTRLSGRSATRDELIRVVGHQEFQLLHFVGHGLADVDGRAGLMLSDGFASFDELTQIMPRASVVVLSACSSGRALNEASKGYFQSGASGVVGFVGPVTDRAANAIAVRFYDKLASGATLGEALRIAKTAQRTLYPADFSWASLVLFGDPTRRLKRDGDV